PPLATSAMTFSSIGETSSNASLEGTRSPPIQCSVETPTPSTRTVPLIGGTVSPRRHGPDSLHDLSTERADLPDVVDELRGLEADRREPPLQLAGDRFQGPPQVGHAVRVGKRAADASDHL